MQTVTLLFFTAYHPRLSSASSSRLGRPLEAAGAVGAAGSREQAGDGVGL